MYMNSWIHMYSYSSFWGLLFYFSVTLKIIILNQRFTHNLYRSYHKAVLMISRRAYLFHDHILLMNGYYAHLSSVRFRHFIYRGSLMMHQKKANAEKLCKIWFVPFVSWLPSSMSNHDGKWVYLWFFHYSFLQNRLRDGL